MCLYNVTRTQFVNFSAIYIVYTGLIASGNITSAKIIQVNGDVGMHHAKNVETGNSLSNTIKDTSTIMRNPIID